MYYIRIYSIFRLNIRLPFDYESHSLRRLSVTTLDIELSEIRQTAMGFYQVFVYYVHPVIVENK